MNHDELQTKIDELVEEYFDTTKSEDDQPERCSELMAVLSRALTGVIGVNSLIQNFDRKGTQEILDLLTESISEALDKQHTHRDEIKKDMQHDKFRSTT